MNDIQEKYNLFVQSCAKPMSSQIENVLHSAIGISGEGGEILDAIKKTWVYNKELDIKNLHEELGDLLFYTQMMCNIFGWTLDELIEANMEKLSKRYPSGYSDAHAQARMDKNKLI